MGAGAAALIWTVPDHASAFQGAFVADSFSRFAKLLILVGAGDIARSYIVRYS